ncbi:porin family protein [uncultured Flavobacterium sp.]|uniref:type IX secretion/gliding motility protein PorT/SprT n=1 Tax=uncultured Flavobacterium sp. TaxID=165435 RepID=UPI0030EF40B7|tara:strand:- start:316876 stop:317565 length:690 start_codon:yes stop_codon:yes gene_type:complete
MKKLFIICFALFTLTNQAQFGKDPIINLENFQKNRVHWGFYLGFNFYDFQFDYKSVTKDLEVQNTTGFNVGLIGNLRLHENIDLRFEPGLYYTERNLIYPDIVDPVDRFREVKSTYIHFPLLVKFSSKRFGNVRPYLIGGVSRSLNLSSFEDSPDDNESDVFRMKKWTNNYELGFGVDLYLEYFIFSPSIRGVFSMNDELVRDKDPNSQWTNNIDAMRTRGVFLNFSFH